MSATSSFVGKAIAQKVSVKSTKASTTVRASAVNKVRVARALDDARMTLSRADTRDLPARRERTNVAPSRVARAVRSRDRRLTVTAYLHRCDRRARVAPPRVASPTVRRVQDPRDRGSVDPSNRGGSSDPSDSNSNSDSRRRRRRTVRDARREVWSSTRAVDRAACTHISDAHRLPPSPPRPRSSCPPPPRPSPR